MTFEVPWLTFMDFGGAEDRWKFNYLVASPMPPTPFSIKTVCSEAHTIGSVELISYASNESNTLQGLISRM